MRILRIGGKNLASLAGEFSVDFEQEPLASSGLYAISGPTGAGKSTLLDTLCLALYDATPRMLRSTRGGQLPDVGNETVSIQDPRNLLRRGAGEAYAEVDFVGTDNARYRARWEVRRARRSAEGALQASMLTLHTLPDLAPLTGTKTEAKLAIEQRIGLSFEQFTRSVLLAQNEFATFLKADDNERGELLETLTGSVQYSGISIRAFERAKQEKEALNQLTARLADQKPLSGEERGALLARRMQAETALATLDTRKEALEQQQRWHEQAQRLAQSEQGAAQALQQRTEASELAAPRRTALARLDAVQAARPLAADIARCDGEIAAAQAAQSSHVQTVKDALAAQQQALANRAQAETALATAETAQRDAAPRLDQAKALDARIEALLPAHKVASAALETATKADGLAKAALQTKQSELRQQQQAQQQGADWLARHQPWQALAEAWPKWDVLFAQAGHAATQADKHAQALTQVQQHGTRQREEDGVAKAALAEAAEKLAALDAQRQQAIAALAAFDADALQTRRGTLEQRRDQLAGGEKVWTELQDKAERKAQLDAQSAGVRQARTVAEQALAQAQQEHAVIMAEYGAAERALKVAEAACAESVEKLRATLEDDTPCPVCGAHDHPYRHDDGALASMLSTLASDVQRSRARMEANVGLQAAQRGTLLSGAERLSAIGVEVHALDEALARLTLSWHAHPLAGEAAAIADALDGWLQGGSDHAAHAAAVETVGARSAWLAAELATCRTALQQTEQQEQGWRRAGAARDAAQQGYDLAQARHTQTQNAATTAAAALAQAKADYRALDEKRIETTQQLTGLLDELDAAFNTAEVSNEDWKDAWRATPAPFHEARRAEARQWQTQRTQLDERAAGIAQLDTEVQALAEIQSRTGQDAAAARETFAAADTGVTAMQEQRMGMWGGKEVRDVEVQLQAAISTARERMAALHDASQQAAQQQARAEEGAAHAAARVEALRGAAVTARRVLGDWLYAYNVKQLGDAMPPPAPPAPPVSGDLFASDGDVVEEEEVDVTADGVLTLRQLQTLLNQEEQAVRAERDAILALEQAVAMAATVLQERQLQRVQHQATGNAAGGNLAGTASAEATAQAMETLLAEHRQAGDTLAAHRLALAQDDDKRQRAAAMMGDIEAQEAAEQRWARMSDLIGSADGKKFRNYAQQFTLDVLLGYANAHLQQLARRYRLERIAHPSTPSLGLMVRDQDMGGELRSVHSLSGGESFLVSLALALGLASLSSNRVRVESLFIDEGFGSLDAETLRVAMDALDGLQAMGRKVGVISHVQEMTERISTRILVQPAAGGRSEVSVLA